MDAATDQDTTSSPVLVGRQAIFDRKLDVYGYELLFRDEGGLNRCDEHDGDLATSRTILNAFVEIGLERLTDGRPAFINLTRGFFTEMPPIPFNPDTVVLEVLEDIPVDAHLIEAVKALHAQGYRVALDDYLFEDKWQPLLPYVSLIKVEITPRNLEHMARHIAPLRERPVTLLAEKVETQAQFRQLHALGFDLFQGYFFARPDTVSQGRLNESRAVVSRLLARLNDPEAEIDEIAGLIGQDPALSFKMLRLINSAAVGLRRRVESIHQAVVLMGLQRMRAWATLFVMAGSDKQPRELINLGLLRANLCERLSRLWGVGAPDTAYTVGLLSILDGMLSLPMDQALAELPLPDPVKRAIGAREGDYGRILDSAIRLESGRLPPGDEAEEARFMEIFLASSEAAFAALHAIET
jgi:EAL and modified HD-GYP domain-containing signal transduction protein